MGKAILKGETHSHKYFHFQINELNILFKKLGEKSQMKKVMTKKKTVEVIFEKASVIDKLLSRQSRNKENPNE